MTVMKVGQTGEVTTDGGLRARLSPNGAPARDGNGKEVLRQKGFHIKVEERTDSPSGGHYWVRGADRWYAETYLKVAGPSSSSSSSSASAWVASPAPGYKVTTPYGKKPNNNTYWQTRGYHTGDDYAAPAGSSAVAVRDGTTVYRWDRVLGHCLLLYANNNRTYWYCHLLSRPSTGTVTANAKVGLVGSTGTGANGSHLHFEMRDGHTTSWSGKDLKPAW
jgi:murein DD-endopeptidase MepM/ murein hydrolase activator NlpD